MIVSVCLANDGFWEVWLSDPDAGPGSQSEPRPILALVLRTRRLSTVMDWLKEELPEWH
jgi:hypothetical protein